MTSSKLKTISFSMGFALVFLITNIGHSFAEEIKRAFNVEFAPGTTLSDEELDSIVKLMYFEGVDEISSIQTVPGHHGYGPMSDENEHMVIVREKPINDGPYPSYRVLSVMGLSLLSDENQSWYSKATYSNQQGGFWVQSTRNVTYFPTEFYGKIVEIKVDERINRDDLERVINALKNDRVETMEKDPAYAWSTAERGLPNAIHPGEYIDGIGQADFTIVYGESSASSSYSVLLEQDKLVIVTIANSIS